MNKEFVLLHLKEAFEELQKTIQEIEAEEEYGFGEFSVAMQHLYQHINTAWNIHDIAPDRVSKCNEEDFYTWRQYPKNLDMSV